MTQKIGVKISRAIRDPGASFDPRVWLLALGTFAIGTDVFVVSGILPAISDDLGLSLSAAGQIVTAYALIYAIGAPLLISFLAQLPQVRVVTLTLGLFAVANGLCALAPSYGLLMAARVMAGITAALYTSTAYSLAASLARPDHRGAALAAVAIGLTASAVLGVPFGTFVGQRLGWRSTFWLVTLVSVVAVLILFFIPPTNLPKPSAAPARLASRFAPLAKAPVLLALLPGLLWNTANMTSYTYLGASLAERHEPNAVTLLFFVYGVGGLVGSQLGGRLTDRFGSLRPLAFCLAIATANQALMGITATNSLTIAAALVVWSVTGWATFAPQQSRLIAIEPQNAPIVIALYHSTIYVGAAAGAAIGGVLMEHAVPATGLHWVTAGLLVVALLALGASALTLRRA